MEIILSIKPNIVDKILTGQKFIEIRCRKMNIDVGTKIWIYSTSPAMEIVGYTYAKEIKYIHRDELWYNYYHGIAISFDEYIIYTKNKSYVTAIFIDKPISLSNTIKLSNLRKHFNSFQPPQFYHKIYEYEKFNRFVLSET